MDIDLKSNCDIVDYSFKDGLFSTDINLVFAVGEKNVEVNISLKKKNKVSWSIIED